MTDEQYPASGTEPDSRTERWLDRWRNGWQDHDEGVLPQPTVAYQGIDWADVQNARDETRARRV